MNLRSKIWVVFTIFSIFTAVVFASGDDKLHVVFCDVGQGDGALIHWRKFVALVDTGPDIGKLDKCLNAHLPFWQRRIDLVFVSHPQSDHEGALRQLEKRYTIGKVVRYLSNNNIVRYGSIEFDMLSGAEAKVEDKTMENDSSMVLLLKFGTIKFLFTGDIDSKQELALIDSGVLTKVDVLKVPHHGSKFGSSEAFLKLLSPMVDVISVGEKNRYGHPNRDTLLRLDVVGSKVYRTDLRGAVEVETDGKVLGVGTER